MEIRICKNCQSEVPKARPGKEQRCEVCGRVTYPEEIKSEAQAPKPE